MCKVIEVTCTLLYTLDPFSPLTFCRSWHLRSWCRCHTVRHRELINDEEVDLHRGPKDDSEAVNGVKQREVRAECRRRWATTDTKRHRDEDNRRDASWKSETPSRYHFFFFISFFFFSFLICVPRSARKKKRKTSFIIRKNNCCKVSQPFIRASLKERRFNHTNLIKDLKYNLLSHESDSCFFWKVTAFESLCLLLLPAQFSVLV